MIVLALIVTLLVVMATGIPVAIGLAAIGLGTGLILDGPDAVFALPQTFYSANNSFLITAIPLFILMSEILRRAGVTEVLFEFVTKWVGHFPGGLAVATVITSAIGAAITGSSIANAATMAMVALDPMLARGYDRRFTCALIAASGTLAILIPPSIPLLLYAAITDESIGKLFAAGMLPGLTLSAILVAYVIAVSMRGRVYKPLPKATWAERLAQTRKAALPLLLPVIVIGGIYTGMFTATEAAGIGTLIAALIALFVFRSLKLRDFGPILMECMQTTCMILLLVAGSTVLGHTVIKTQISQDLLTLIESYHLSATGFVIAMMALLLVLGCILEVISIIYIVLPIIMPVLLALKIDLIWFAIMFVVNMEIALVTPPVGMALYVITAISKRPISEVIQGSLPFVALLVAFLVLLMLFPWLVLVVPRMM
jgi:C4-dicarboxylate transporter DctM subunit